MTHVRLERLSEAETAALLAAADRPARAVPRGRRAAPPHRRQPVLPRGAAARPRGRRPGRRWASSRCRGAWPRCCAGSSTTSSPAAQRIVEAAAVLGHRVPFDLLAARHRRRRGRADRARCASWSRAACWSRPARTSSASGTRWSARRSPGSCSAGSAAGCTRPRWRRCSPPAARDPAMVAAPRPGRRPVRRHGRRRPPGRRARTCPSARRTRRCSWPRWGWTRSRDDVELLAARPRAAWLAGLLDDAQSATPGAGATAATDAGPTGPTRCYLLIRLAWEADELERDAGAHRRGRAAHRPAAAPAPTRPGR